MLTAIRRSIGRRLGGESGFALVVVLAIMSVVVLFSVGAFAAVNGDLPGSGEDIGRKQALAAAEAGVADYLFHLNEDSAYWTKCTAAGPGLNDPWSGTRPPATANWRTVPGAANSRYAIELLPARNSGFTTCNPSPANAAKSMIDPGTRGLRIRVTGEARTSKGTVRRQVVVNLRRANFLDYLWFTDYETTDPVWFVTTTRGGASTGPNGDLLSWAATNCARYYRPGPAGASGYNRAGAVWTGHIDRDRDGIYENSGSAGDETNLSVPCVINDPQFAGFDELLGPVHTNDELLTCDGFTLGRLGANDPIESGRSWRPCSAGATPNIRGTLIQNAPMIKLPPTDASLGQIASPTYTFTGRTEIRLGIGSITVRNPFRNGGASYSLPYPSNGVIYVKNGTPCGYSYQPLNPYNALTNNYDAASLVPVGCGQAWVRGTYDTSLTIAAQDDVIIDGDIRNSAADIATSEQRLGLIADNFIRVWHRVNRDSSNPTQCSEPSGADRINGRRIDAAMLSLLHSFMVDNYYCGGSLGTLTINGVIGQKFRGPVGTSGGTGFQKDYNYDQRLAFKSPPHFLDPVESAWKVTGWTEQQGGS